MKKRTLTLIEIMIVIVLIGLIGSVIGVNMKGSLDKGKEFKTEQAITQIQDILELAVAQGHSPDEVVLNWDKHLSDSGLVKDPKKFILDGWNKELEIRADSRGKISVVSENLKKYKAKQKVKKGEPMATEQEQDE